jgi:hypothetical protein
MIIYQSDLAIRHIFFILLFVKHIILIAKLLLYNHLVIK